MRYSYYLIMMFFAICSLQSQPFLSINSIPQIGETFTVNYCDTTGVEAGEGGANMSWNFSTLKFLEGDGSVETTNIVAPSSGIKYQSFPSATYAYENEGGYSYFKVVDNKIERLGTGYEAGEEILTKSEIIYGLPFSYSDVYEGSFSGSIKTDNIITRRGGRILTVADGFGNIILPNGAFPNLLRLKIEQSIYDTIPPVIPGAPTIVSLTETVTYIWVSDEYKYGLLNISTITNSQFMMGNLISKIVTKKVTVQDAEPGAEIYMTTPGIISPIEGSDNLQLPFKIEWSESEVITPGSIKPSIQNSITYKLQVSGLSDFSDMDLMNEYILTDQTSMQYSDDLLVNDLYIRVQASFADIQSDWSNVTSVKISEAEMTLSTPEIIAPLNGSNIDEYPILFAWTESELTLPGVVNGLEESEVQYLLQLSSLEDFSNEELIIGFKPTPDSFIEVVDEIPFDEVYARVKAIYEDIESEWSELVHINLKTPALPVPTLISPLNGATDIDYESVTLTWAPDNTVTRFQFMISGGSINTQQFIENSNSVVLTDLEADTEYTWSVRAASTNGETSDWAENRTFKTKSTVSVKSNYFNDERLVVSPHPVNNIANVKFSLSNDDEINLKIFSIEGKLLYLRNIGFMTAGEHNINLTLDGFSSGAYYLSLEGNRFNFVRNLIIH